MKLYQAGIGLFIAMIVAAVVWSVVETHRWIQACHDAGGWVEQRWEYATMDMYYNYDARGNIVSVVPIVTQHYSYHCWVNHQEVAV